MLLETHENIKQYNNAVNGINECLRSLQLSQYQLPVINQQEISIKITSEENSQKAQSHFDSAITTPEI